MYACICIVVLGGEIVMHTSACTLQCTAVDLLVHVHCSSYAYWNCWMHSNMVATNCIPLEFSVSLQSLSDHVTAAQSYGVLCISIRMFLSCDDVFESISMTRSGWWVVLVHIHNMPENIPPVSLCLDSWSVMSRCDFLQGWDYACNVYIVVLAY